jgi:Na+/proline symporter
VYGNFSIYGFLLPAVLLGIVLARATAALRWSASPAAIVFAAFAMTRVLPFEQEFGSLLFGWYKLVPFVLVALLFYPLRRPRTRTQAATLELQPLTF